MHFCLPVGSLPRYATAACLAGISLIELATGYYPVPGEKPDPPLAPITAPGKGRELRPKRKAPQLAIFEMVASVVKGPSPWSVPVCLHIFAVLDILSPA